MGNTFAKILSMFEKQRRVIMIGLDNAGKTSLLYYLKNGSSLATVPTVGFNVEKINVGPIALKMWDVGGQNVVRELWTHYLKEPFHAVIFIVDSADHDRFNEAKDELHKIMVHGCAEEATLLLVANK